MKYGQQIEREVLAHLHRYSTLDTYTLQLLVKDPERHKGEDSARRLVQITCAALEKKELIGRHRAGDNKSIWFLTPAGAKAIDKKFVKNHDGEVINYHRVFANLLLVSWLKGGWFGHPDNKYTIWATEKECCESIGGQETDHPLWQEGLLEGGDRDKRKKVDGALAWTEGDIKWLTVLEMENSRRNSKSMQSFARFLMRSVLCVPERLGVGSIDREHGKYLMYAAVVGYNDKTAEVPGRVCRHLARVARRCGIAKDQYLEWLWQLTFTRVNQKLNGWEKMPQEERKELMSKSWEITENEGIGSD